MRNEETLAQLIISLMGENNNKTNKQKSRSVILLQRKGFARTLCVVCSVSAGCHPMPLPTRSQSWPERCWCRTSASVFLPKKGKFLFMCTVGMFLSDPTEEKGIKKNKMGKKSRPTLCGSMLPLHF